MKKIRNNYNESIKFVYLGRLEEEKGILLLIDSFNKVKSNNVELLIAGDGKYKKYVKDFTIKDKRIKYLDQKTKSMNY